MRWSKLKQNVESFFSPKVAGRVALHLTCYREAHDQIGRGWITIDGEEVANMCYQLSLREGEPRIEIDESASPGTTVHRGVMSPFNYTQVLFEYLSTSIDDALASANYLTRGLAVLDGRCGKRRLASLSCNSEEHPLVTKFLTLRCEVEGITNDRNGQKTTKKID
jgi:hypothetical protein